MTPETKRSLSILREREKKTRDIPEGYLATQPVAMLRGADWARENDREPARYSSSVTEWQIRCQMTGVEALNQTVEVNSKIRSGIPVLRGTRITIAQLYAELSQTAGPDDVAKRFRVDADLVRNFLDGMSLLVNKSMK